MKCGTKNVPRDKWGYVCLCLFVTLSFAASSRLNPYPETCHFQGSPTLPGVQPAKGQFPDYYHMVEMSSGLNCDPTMQIGDASTSPREISQNWSLEFTQTAPPEVRQEVVLYSLDVEGRGQSSGQNHTLPPADHTGVTDRPPRGQDDLSFRENELGPDFEVKFDIETNIDFTDSTSQGYMALKDEISQLLYNLLSRNVDGLKAVDVISLRPGSVIAYCRLVLNSTGQPLPDVSSGLGSLAGQTVTLTGHHAHITLQFPSGDLVNLCDIHSVLFHCQDKICQLHGGEPVCICLPGFKERSTINSTCVDVDECSENSHCCDHVCTNTIGSFTCSCHQGYELSSDGRTCRHDGAFFLIASDEAILRMDANNFTAKPLPIREQNTVAVDYDPVEENMYWTDARSTYVIKTAKLDGRDMQTIFRPPKGGLLGTLALDPLSRLLFYADDTNRLIGILTLSTHLHRTVINSGLEKPESIVLDTANGVMFWADWGDAAKIERANYDGSNRRVLVNTGLIYVFGLVLDTANSRLYWVDARTNLIESADLQGNGRRTIFRSENSLYCIGMELFDNALYLLEWGLQSGKRNNHVLRKPLSLSGGLTSVFNDTRLMRDIIAYRPGPLGSNGCSNNNGGCSVFCTPLPGNRSRCMCPDCQRLSTDGLTCVEATCT